MEIVSAWFKSRKSVVQPKSTKVDLRNPGHLTSTCWPALNPTSLNLSIDRADICEIIFFQSFALVSPSITLFKANIADLKILSICSSCVLGSSVGLVLTDPSDSALEKSLAMPPGSTVASRMVIAGTWRAESAKTWAGAARFGWAASQSGVLGSR
ncbi:hypothetical protein PCASD_15410 [Puccinia coronata f. sp. avenae]|uniref:Uncharacterized protein n=1 Tax=Puccinia coronata f. sp. avenae TaxID=200324 RepID=A0A2N5TZ24_9BASI|nr:hypothetical protein PCASD_15410 [Puccinia coronata f. sp. avenae]